MIFYVYFCKDRNVAFFKEYLFDRDTQKNKEIRFILCIYDQYRHYLKICKENQTEFFDMENTIWEATLLEYGSKSIEMPSLQQAKYYHRLFTDQKRTNDYRFYIQTPKKKYA